jgi:hypothetical protein
MIKKNTETQMNRKTRNANDNIQLIPMYRNMETIDRIRPGPNTTTPPTPTFPYLPMYWTPGRNVETNSKTVEKLPSE